MDRGPSVPGKTDHAGLYLAIYDDDDDGRFAFLEAFDTWRHPDVTFDEFKTRVKHLNGNVEIHNNVEAQYTTQNGNRLHFVIWEGVERDNALSGARILRIEYGGDPDDAFGDAGNTTDRFLSGTVMNSPREAVVEITNRSLGTKLTLDLSDPWHPRRTSESGDVEVAGTGHDVWVNFAWTGPSEGDFFRPYTSLAAAAAAVADGGVIRIMPGSTGERIPTSSGKRLRLVAPIGGVNIGVRP